MLSTRFLEELRTGRTWSVLILLALFILWESLRPFFQEFRSSRERGTHALRNLGIAAVNFSMASLLFATLSLQSSIWSEENSFGLLHRFDMHWITHAVLAVLILDFWTYWWHRWNHRIPFLWRFHHVHHSDPQMDVTTALRFHFGEMAISSILRLPILAFAGIYLWELVFFEFLMFPVVMFHHSNVRLPKPWDQIFRFFFASPDMHKIHHSQVLADVDSNFTSFFSIWDRIFGTYRMHGGIGKIVFGIPGEPKSEEAVAKLLTRPFRPTQLPCERDID